MHREMETSYLENAIRSQYRVYLLYFELPHIPSNAMRNNSHVCLGLPFTSLTLPYSQDYSSWEADSNTDPGIKHVSNAYEPISSLHAPALDGLGTGTCFY